MTTLTKFRPLAEIDDIVLMQRASESNHIALVRALTTSKPGQKAIQRRHPFAPDDRS